MKKTKIDAVIKVILNGKLCREHSGSMNVEEVELLLDVMDILWHDEQPDKKALKRIKDAIKYW